MTSRTCADSRGGLNRNKPCPKRGDHSRDRLLLFTALFIQTRGRSVKPKNGEGGGAGGAKKKVLRVEDGRGSSRTSLILLQRCFYDPAVLLKDSSFAEFLFVSFFLGGGGVRGGGVGERDWGMVCFPSSSLSITTTTTTSSSLLLLSLLL